MTKAIKAAGMSSSGVDGKSWRRGGWWKLIASRHGKLLIRRLLLLALLLFAPSLSQADERLTFGRFGVLELYRSSSHPSQVVLFVSGDGGWNSGVVDMAKALVSLDALVVGIDIRRYLGDLRATENSCWYPAADLEALSQYVQKRLDFPSYRTPVLVGYSSGATLVYATLAQAPPNTFLGGISLGFCPEWPGATPFCKGSGLVSRRRAEGAGVALEPATGVASPWIVLQGGVDKVCDARNTGEYVERVRGAEIVPLPKVGHGFSVQKNWMPQFRDAFTRLVAQRTESTATPDIRNEESTQIAPAEAASITDLPVVEVPATASDSNVLAFVASGDGGWAGLDRQLANVFASKGVPVVGLDTLRYYWRPKTPEASARALERILRHFLVAWKKERVLLVGYSRGADVLPFMASRLPADLMERVDLIALLGPEPTITFEFHYSDWIHAPNGNVFPVWPEIEKLRGRKILCVYGSDERDSVCPQLPVGLAHLERRPGGHHFGGDYRAIADLMLSEVAR